ncbi:hypothetical protein AB0M29_17635 [Streptomyces sp. NPDC051976]|uniref:hypothetical protein n=1 Tax=Streptomyces sp. NPDC051976 TaxID=3154947 RepID=UPI003427955C
MTYMVRHRKGRAVHAGMQLALSSEVREDIIWYSIIAVIFVAGWIFAVRSN